MEISFLNSGGQSENKAILSIGTFNFVKSSWISNLLALYCLHYWSPSFIDWILFNTDPVWVSSDVTANVSNSISTQYSKGIIETDTNTKLVITSEYFNI